jgi:Recombination endonuclease VII
MPHTDPAKRREYMKKYRAAHPEYVQKDMDKEKERLKDPEVAARRRAIKQARLANPEVRERRRKQWREWAQANRYNSPDKNRARALKRLYGLTQDQYDAMSVAQDHKCASCGALEIEQKHGVLVVDHCHATGKVRGLLCNQCNLILGLSNDNPVLLRRWADYLEKNKN